LSLNKNKLNRRKKVSFRPAILRSETSGQRMSNKEKIFGIESARYMYPRQKDSSYDE